MRRRIIRWGCAGAGRNEEAIKAYRKAIMIKPDFEEAKKSLEKAMETKDEKTAHP